jgi:hypothetical protein
MAAIAELKALLKMDTSQYDTSMKKTTSKTSRFQKGMSASGKKMSVAFTAGAAAVAAAAVAVGKLAGKMISARAEVEAFSVQFQAFGFSAEEAADRVNQLTSIAGKTPFQLADIVGASQTLESLTDGALGGAESMKFFGDAAAAVGQTDLKDMSFWVGRMHAALQNGLPFIDSANALMRLKMVSGETVAKMREMNEAGVDGGEIWELFTSKMEKFEGGMEKLAETTSGKISTMKDNWTIAFAEMGKAMEPLTKELINFSTFIAKEVTLGVSGKGFFEEEDEAAGVAQGQKRLNRIKDQQQAKERADRKAAEQAKKEKDERDKFVKEQVQLQKQRGEDFRKRIKARKEIGRKSDKQIESRTDQFDEAVERIQGRRINVTGKGQDVDAMAAVGGMIGGSRGALGIADRQLQLKRESNKKQDELVKLTQEFKEDIRVIREEAEAEKARV